MNTTPQTTPQVGARFIYRYDALTAKTWTITKVTEDSVAFEQQATGPWGDTYTTHSGMTRGNFDAMIAEGRATILP